jgi:hypothetical protein
MNKKKKTSEPIHLTPEEQAFDDELEDMLRSTGYLFPLTPGQIDTYRKLNADEEPLKESNKAKDELKKKQKK